MRNANLPEFYGTRPNSVKSQSTASMRSGHGKGEYAPRDALFLAPGNWYQTIYYHTHPCPPKANWAS